MVYRRLALLASLSVTVAAEVSAAGVVREIEKDLIREEAVMDILGVPAFTDIEPDLAVVRSIFQRRISTEDVAAAMPGSGDKIQVFAQRFAITAEQALKLVADTFRYNVVRVNDVAVNGMVAMPSSEATIAELLEVVEREGRVRISVYPESQMIVVRGQ